MGACPGTTGGDRLTPLTGRAETIARIRADVKNSRAIPASDAAVLLAENERLERELSAHRDTARGIGRISDEEMEKVNESLEMKRDVDRVVGAFISNLTRNT